MSATTNLPEIRQNGSLVTTTTMDLVNIKQKIQHKVHGVDTPSPEVESLAIDVSGKLLAALYPDNELRLFNAEDGDFIRKFTLNASIRAISSTSAGSFTILQTDGAVVVVQRDIEKPIEMGMVDLDIVHKATFVRVIENNKVLCTVKNTLVCIGVNGQVEQLHEFDEDITGIAFDHGTVALLKIGESGKIAGWHVKNSNNLFALSIGKSISSMAVSFNGEQFALKTEDGVSVWKLAADTLPVETAHYKATVILSQMLSAYASALGQHGNMMPNVREEFEKRVKGHYEKADVTLDNSGAVMLLRLTSDYEGIALCNLVTEKYKYIQSAELMAVANISGISTLRIVRIDSFMRYANNNGLLFLIASTAISCIDISSLHERFTIKADSCITVTSSAVTEGSVLCKYLSGNVFSKAIALDNLTVNTIGLVRHDTFFFNISPDGKFIATPLNNTVITGSNDHYLQIQEAKTGAVIHRFGHDDWVLSAAFTSDNQILVGCDYSVPSLSDAGCLVSRNVGIEPAAIRRSKLGKQITKIFACHNGSAIVQTDSGELLFVAKNNTKTEPLFKGKIVVGNYAASLVCLTTSASENKEHVILDMSANETNQILQRFLLEFQEILVALDGQGRLIVLKDNKLDIVNISGEPTIEATIQRLQSSPIKTGFMDNERLLVTVHKHQVTFWDYEKRIELATCTLFNNGEVWTTPPDEAAPNGWFWTDRPELIALTRCNEDGSNQQPVPDDDPERLEYIKLYNDRRMVMNRLNNWEQYQKDVNIILGKIPIILDGDPLLQIAMSA